MTTSQLARTIAAVAVSAAFVGGAATSATGAQARPASTVKPFSTDRIVVQKSIGGIRIGESAAAARKGFPAKSCDSYQCTYKGAGYQVYFEFDAPKPGATKVVNNITIAASKSGTSATKVRTKAGIGIGSTAAAVHKAYPKARKEQGVYFIGSGKPNTVLTFFALDDAKKHVAQVTVALQLGH
ncbi:MAG: hypothetical protein JWP74_492 [Marmoricola sp.]|nr:hypothetical protein [Marmoricola sp.]